MGNKGRCSDLRFIMKYDYAKRDSKILGKINRPLIPVTIINGINKIEIDEMLADTGADITIIPRYFGELVVQDITAGQYIEIKGIAPSSVLVAFIHQMKMIICGKEFESKVAISESNDIPPVLGRLEALDKFTAIFKKGVELELIH